MIAATQAFRCSLCEQHYNLNEEVRNCSRCGAPLILHHDLARASRTLRKETFESRAPGVWRFRELLPFQSKTSIISLGEGGTYLHRCRRLSEKIGIRRLYVKNETLNPTGSFSDRGMTVSVTRAVEKRCSHVSCAPTGNLGASLAAYAARAGLRCTIHVTTDLDLGKLYQMIAYGADLRLQPSMAEASSMAMEKPPKGFFVSATDPFFMDGTKTLGFELCLDLGWRAPERVIVPVGSGADISMIWRGIQDFEKIGFLKDSKTRMTAVQAEGCAPIVQAFMKKHEKITPSQGVSTIAVDIGIRNPPLGDLALRTIRETHGAAVAVSDKDILEATSLLARTEGIFAEPAAASTIAGLIKLVEQGQVQRTEEVVCVITGAGLKDPNTARRLVERSRNIEKVISRREPKRLTKKLGETKIRILEILARRDEYGYSIWKILKREYGIFTKIPSVYQHLAELEIYNLIKRTKAESNPGHPERYYHAITERGRETLESLSKMKL